MSTFQVSSHFFAKKNKMLLTTGPTTCNKNQIQEKVIGELAQNNYKFRYCFFYNFKTIFPQTIHIIKIKI